MSQPDAWCWTFSTVDPIEKVGTFKKRKTGLIPKAGSGSYLLAVKKGDSDFSPDHGVMIEPNKTFPPPAKTVITVTNKKRFARPDRQGSAGRSEPE